MCIKAMIISIAIQSMSTTKNSKLELLGRKEFQGTFKTKPFFLKGKCIKKRKLISISVVPTKIKSSSSEEKVHDHEQTHYKKLVGNFIDDQEVKMTLSHWKELRIPLKIKHERQIARLQLEQIQNTAGFNDDMNAMHDFQKLVGCSMTYPTYTRIQCFGIEAKESEERFLYGS